MSIAEVINKLKDNCTLENRGTGWYLAEPRKSYTRAKSFLISDDLVDKLVSEKIIEIKMPYNTAKAKLIEA